VTRNQDQLQRSEMLLQINSDVTEATDRIL